MCNVMVSYSRIHQKVQRNKRQSRHERADPIISQQSDQSTIIAIRVDQIRDEASRSEGNYQIGADRSVGKQRKTRHIGAEEEHHGKREEPCQKRKEKRSEKIRVASEKSSANQRGESSVLKNNAELGEYPIRKGIQTTAAKYTVRWEIM